MLLESVWRPGVLACGCNIKVVCKSGQTLCLMLTKTWRIHSHWRSSPTWYTRSCTCSRGKLYISETKRRPKTRIKNGTQRCMHEAFHQQVSQTGASMDSESSHYMLLEQGKRAGLYSLSYWTGFEGGDVHPDINWKQLNQPGQRAAGYLNQKIWWRNWQKPLWPSSGYMYTWVCGHKSNARCG